MVFAWPRDEAEPHETTEDTRDTEKGNDEAMSGGQVDDVCVDRQCVEETGCTTEELLIKAIEHHDYEEMQRLHDLLTTDPSWQCDGEVMRAAVKEGNDAFVVRHLTHCPSSLPWWLASLVVSCGRVEVMKHLLTCGDHVAEDLVKATASIGSMEVVRWLHQHVEPKWTVMAMDEASRHGRHQVVQWLHAHRTEECSTPTVTSVIALRSLELVRDVYDGVDLRIWPRPGNASTLVRLAQSNHTVDREILKHIVSCRRKRYRSVGAENPEEYMPLGGQRVESAPDVIEKQFTLTAAVVVCQVRGIPGEISKLISKFVIFHPSSRFSHEEAVQRGLTHWLLLFSACPNEVMVALAEVGHVEEACYLHDRLARDKRVQCSKRLVYLTVEKGSLDTIKWHVVNCEAHNVDEWLYVATWIGRVDVIEWMIDEWTKISVQTRKNEEHKDAPTRKKMFHSLDASFAMVEERFDYGLMDIEASMNDAEDAARSGKHSGLAFFLGKDMPTTNLADLAAIYDHVDTVECLLREWSQSCTVSGLYGAIVRGHFSVVESIYANQPGLADWPSQEDGSTLLRRLLSSDTEELRAVVLRSKNPRREEESLHRLIKFYRDERNMRMDSSTLEEAAFRGDMARVELICQYDLVDNKTGAADIAAARGDLKMLEVLFAANSAGSKCTTRALVGAAERGHLEVLKYLHEHGAPYSSRAMDVAALNGHVDIVQFLLEHNHDACSPYALQWACSKGHKDVVKCLLAASLSIAWDIAMCIQVARQRGMLVPSVGPDASVPLVVASRKLDSRRRAQEKTRKLTTFQEAIDLVMSSVVLRVYDLSRGMARQLSPSLLGKQIDGIWHTGVLVYGQEYFYGGGVQVMAPELVVARYGMQPVQQIDMGTTHVAQHDFETFLRGISPRFTAQAYDLLRHNCNNFSNELTTYLLGKSIPQHILDLPNEALSTPMGAMLRPMIENMQQQMHATGSEPFAIPFNDPSRATAAVSTTPVPRPSGSALSRHFTVSGRPNLHLKQIIRRIVELNGQEQDSVPLSDADLKALEELPAYVDDKINLQPKEAQDVAHADKCVAWWRIVEMLLERGASSPFFFPALGLFRVLLLLPTKAESILAHKNTCFDHVLRVSEQETPLFNAQTVLLLSVLVNAFANPVASELVLTRAVQFLPFVFRALAESQHPDVRVVSAKLISNCCLALQIEEELVITTILCGSVEVLERLSTQSSSPQHQVAVEGVVVGVGRLLKNFEGARSLSVELGLADVLRRLRGSPSLSTIQPLVSEVVALI
ncbi:hypothetical protein Poli38472_003625 [Pythium oligandrum]|uniref:PPPDE domain-containing protein n=1 Tax=Pythium oligandrum TaxID=41045 RepID=A0A8K1CM77_PYTOL|nr:hypothetical protein Poli38472_003625 [Pythium oligandrum]|eukprot:TMW65860.1 hypothetical protein Poli38472_003625 [Pythium oligandrum]